MPNTLHRCMLATPLGPMVAVASERALCGLEFDLPKRQELLALRLRNFHGDPRLVDDAPELPIFVATRRWLADYFAHRPVSAVPLELRGSDFEERVWQRLCQIPLGERVTYGELAAELGLQAGARAVGGASRRNPISLLVPCHRVVGATGSLTGYGGGIENKGWLLRHEEAHSARVGGRRGISGARASSQLHP